MPDLFNMGFSNNAPPPIPGGYGNPTGSNTGGFNTNSKLAFPISPNAVASPFPANGGTPTNPMAGLSSGFAGIGGVAAPGTKDDNLGHELVSAYGQGTGNAILQLLYKGMFNPQVAQSLLASLQPGIQRGQADILNAFGAGGNRFSSSAALGLGDFNSQVNLNQGQILSNLFLQDQQMQQQLLEQILPTMHAEKANKKGIMGDILGGLEIAGGIATLPFGGAGAGLIGMGIGTLAGSNSGGGSSGGGGGGGFDLSGLLSHLTRSGSKPDIGSLSPTGGFSNDALASMINQGMFATPEMLSGAGGDAFFGTGSDSMSTGLPF
jgi:hypothetical protein